MQKDEVVLVNEQDEELGTIEKLAAHQKGLLHRAFSVLIFNSKGELLLQQRALHKYHCPGMWSNTVCSHPKKGEKSLSGAERRLKEEMGFTCPLEEKLHFIYKVELANGLTEHEFDRVFVGYYEGKLVPNPKEVMDYKWISREALTKEMEEFPQQYTEWFKIMLQEFSL